MACSSSINMLLILLYNAMSSVRVNVNKVTAIKYVAVLPLYYRLAILDSKDSLALVWEEVIHS